MKRNGILVCIGLAFALALRVAHGDTNGQQLAVSAGRPLVGMPAPRLIVKTIDGATIDLGRLYGRKAVYLKFWATWCTYCREQMPDFEHTYETAGPDLAVIAVDIGLNDTLADVRAFQRNMHITMPIVIDDGRLAQAFQLRVTPQHIVIGRDGRVLYVGHLADTQLHAALRAARTIAVSAHSNGALSAPAEAAIVHLGVGDVLPEESRRTLKGARFSLRDPQQSRRTILVFISPWCEDYLATTRPAVSAACRNMRLAVAALARNPAVHVRWLGIASGLWVTTQDLKDYQLQYGVRIPLTLDASGRDFRTFDVTQMPTAVIISDHGRVLRKIVGEQFRDAAGLRAALSPAQIS